MHRTIEEWQAERMARLSPRLANQALMDLLWDDLPEILARAAEVERLLSKLNDEVEHSAELEDRAITADAEVERLRECKEATLESAPCRICAELEAQLEAVRGAMFTRREYQGLLVLVHDRLRGKNEKKHPEFCQYWGILRAKIEIALAATERDGDED